LGGQFATPRVNVLAFISKLGPIHNPQMLKVGPKFFWPCLLVKSGPYATHVVFIVNVVCNYFLITNCSLKITFFFFNPPPLTHSFCVKNKFPNALKNVSTEIQLQCTQAPT
jgi:hypothetical protein